MIMLQSSMAVLSHHQVLARLHLATHMKLAAVRNVAHSSKEVRRSFIDYFVNNGHKHVRSSPVIPFCDPTLAFVNAGMNQFKGIFLGTTKPLCKAAVNSQKCIRVGGKHNDLEVVGTDGYHHTFFEMLGNWSFGDYFKKEACEMAWNLLTGPYGLDPNRLYVTYFGGDKELHLEPDLETKDIWMEIGVSPDHILPFGLDENFWEMGAVGPCGPCTEIHVDHIAERQMAAERVNQGYDDVTEIWNLVFIQYNRSSKGDLKLLPSYHVDTGMGLERLVAVLQGKNSNYDTDLFQPIFEAIHKHCRGVPPYEGKFGENADVDCGYRILADHARMMTVALADGMFPDQNHKLRRIMRKAMQVAQERFGVEQGLLPELAYHVAETLNEYYPEISSRMKQVQLIIKHEEELLHSLRNSATAEWKKLVQSRPEMASIDIFEMPGLVAGYQDFMERVSSLKRSNNFENILPFELAFKLYDTFGLEEDIIEKLASIEGLHFDCSNFRQYRNEMKFWSRSGLKCGASSDMVQEVQLKLKKAEVKPTDDSSKYQYHKYGERYVFPVLKCEVKALIVGREVVQEVSPGTNCSIVLDKTNLYHEAGGQESDHGQLIFSNGSATFSVSGVENIAGYVMHQGIVKGTVIRVGDKCITKIDEERRLGSMKNHTTTHLVNAALHKFLTVTCQKSSHITDKGFTFDFSVYGETLSMEHIALLEDTVVKCIKAGAPVKRKTITVNELLTLEGVTLVPGEVYPETGIHIIDVEAGQLLKSREPCCGTHVLNSADIEDFCIINVRSGGTGMRSLRAVTGFYTSAVRHAGKIIKEKVESLAKSFRNNQQVEKLEEMLQQVKQEINTNADSLPYLVRVEELEKINALNKKIKEIVRKDLRKLMEAELQNLASKEYHEPYLVHLLQASSEIEHIPLSKATKKFTRIPVMFLSKSGSTVKARCCVPAEKVTSNFDAELWMSVVMDCLEANGAAPKGQNPHLVFSMKEKRIPGVSFESKLKEAMEKAESFAYKHLVTYRRGR